MNLMKKLVLGLIALFVLSGCSDISKVKTGTLAFDKSLSIGDAFDKYKYFKSTKWSDLETDNGKKVVQVDCEIDLDKHPSGAEWKANLNSMSVVVQFTINKDDTFQISYYGLEAVAKNGEKSEHKTNVLQMNTFLKELYANTPIS